MKRVFVFLAMAALVFSWPVSVETARQAAEGHIARYGAERNIKSEDILISGGGTAYIYHLSPQGFVVLTGNTDIDPVIGWSFENDLSLEESLQNAALSLIREHTRLTDLASSFYTPEQKAENSYLWQSLLDAEPMEEMEIYGPLIDTHWAQGTPYNSYAPIDPETGRRSVTGCVATAMAQVIDYYEYPGHITFYDYFDYTSSYTDPEIFVEATPASMDTIDYRGGGSTPTNETIARLMKACGVSVQMNYSSSASGTNVYAAHMTRYWRFGFAVDLDPASDDFLSELASSIMNDRPCLFSIYGSAGGHQVVCDGYNSTSSTFHLNMGWGGYSDGWWNFTSTMPSGFTYVTGAIAHMTKPRYRRLEVPTGAYPDIQTAIDYAWQLDTIVVADGRHTGTGFRNIQFEGKQVYLRSESGAAACTLRGYEGYTCFYAANAEGRELVIDGFTILDYYMNTTGSIYLQWASPTIKNCIITRGFTETEEGGHGVNIIWGYPRIENTVIYDNYTYKGGGLNLEYGSPEVINCSIYDNYALYGAGVWMASGSSPVFINTIIDSNYCYGEGAAVYLDNEGEPSVPSFYHCLLPTLDAYVEPDGGELNISEGTIYGKSELDGDFEPGDGSYAIDAGTESLSYMDIAIPAKDIYGNGRPQGAACDIGAVESDITAGNRKPFIHMDRAIRRIPVGGSLIMPFSIYDPEGDPVTRELDAPTGATVIGGNSIVWDASEEGTYPFTMTASDGELVDTVTIDVQVVGGICGPVTGVWGAGIYEIDCDIYVEDSLIILPGAELIFNGPYNFIVTDGAVLIAEGTESDSIIFHGGGESWGGLTIQRASSRTRLSYCTIKEADASLKNILPWGGGIHINESDITLSNCLFTENTAEEGGGIYAEYSEIEINDCHFMDNEGGSGGGIHTFCNTQTITGGLFENNHAYGNGGGGMSFVYSFTTGEDMMASGNTTDGDGGGIRIWDGSADISDCTIIDNMSSRGSGGIDITKSNTNVSQCLLEGNSGVYGGGLYISDQAGNASRIEKNIFRDNQGYVDGGGLAVFMSTTTQINTNVFIGNEAPAGGGVSLMYASPIMMNNTITDNLSEDNEGGGIFTTYNSRPIVHNCIIRDNRSGSGSGNADIFVETGDCILHASHCNIDRSEAGGAGMISYRTGNIDEDAMFTDEYHISGESPCINAGARIAENPGGDGSYMAPFRDIDDTFRPQDGEWDIGADEAAMAAVEERIEIPEEISISAYPNPFNSAVNITVPENEHFEITDLSGRVIGSGKGSTLWQPGEDLSTGVYLVRVKGAEMLKITYMK